MSKTKFFPMCLLLLMSLISCSVREEASFETGMGGIRLELPADLTATRADAEGQLSPHGVIVRTWQECSVPASCPSYAGKSMNNIGDNKTYATGCNKVNKISFTLMT